MWNPNSDGKWGPSYQDIEQFFSYGYYGDYGYQYHSDNHDLQPYNGSYYQENQYPDVNNQLLVSLEHGISDLSVAVGHHSSHAVQEQQLVLYPGERLQVASNAVPEHALAFNPAEQYQSFTINQEWRHGSSLLNYYNGELLLYL